MNDKRTKSKPGKGERTTKRPLRLEWIEAGSLADNPANWRRHPAGQMRALKATMDDVGWAATLLYNETTGRLIDGHLRKACVDPKTVVPVLVGRWTAEQEKKILVSLDPLGAMAQADGDALESLLVEVDLDGEGMGDLAALLNELSDADEGDAEPKAARERKQVEAKSAARQRKVSELYSVIVECKNERDQLAFYRRMQKENRKCKLYVL